MITLLMRYLARLPLGHPKTVVAVCAVLTAIAAIFVPRLSISTDRNLIAGSDNEASRLRDEMNEKFGTALVAAVIIQGGDDPAEVHRAADELAAALATKKELIKGAFHKADVAFFERHALVFAKVDSLKNIAQSIDRDDFGFDVLAKSDSLPAMIEGYVGRMESSPLPEDAKPEDVDKAFETMGEIVDELARWARDSSGAPFDIIGKIWKGGPALSGSASSDGYLAEKDGKAPHLAVVFVQPQSNSQAMEVVTPFTDLIRAEAAKVTARHAGFTSFVTGMPALTTDEMRVVTRDIFVTGILAGLGVLLIFIWTYRSLRVGAFVVGPLGVGLVWTSGLTAILYGHLTMISGYFAAELFGLGVAYTIYMVTRMHEALLDGEDKRQAVETALLKAGPGVVGSGTTTAAAFFAIALSDFRGFAEMGVIAGLGVVIILAANLTLLPAALLLWHPGRAGVRTSSYGGAFWGSLGKAPRAVVFLGLAVCIAGIAFIGRIGFDYAVENLLPSTAESVKGLHVLNERTDFSTNYVVAEARSLGEAEAKRERFAALPSVVRAEALSMFVPTDQAAKLEILSRITPEARQRIVTTFAAVRANAANAGKTTPAQLAAALQTVQDTMNDLAFDAKKAGRREAIGLTALANKVGAARASIAAMKNPARLGQLEKQIFEGLARAGRVLEAGLDEKGFTAAELPAEVRGRYVSPDGNSFAVLVYPKGDIGQRDFFEKFVAEILSVDPKTTGHPVTHLAFTHQIHKGFKQATAFAAIAVLLIIVLDLRKPRELLVAIAPVIIGGGWTALFIIAFDIKFNYASIMALPILIGTGVDFGINLAHRARQERSAHTAVRTTGKAIVISASTTLLGFGTLIISDHWGARSLGLILVVGIASCMTAALVVMPRLVERLYTKGDA
jgi:uncharacterized protein